MKIFLFIESLAEGKGGVERVAANLSNQMIKKGHEVYMGYKLTHKEISYDLDPKVSLVPYESIDSIRNYLKLLLEISPDVFHCFYYNRFLLKVLKIINRTDLPLTVQECTTPNRLINNWRKKTNLSIHEAFWEREIALSRAHQIRLTHSDFVYSLPNYIKPQVFAFPNPVESHNKKANLLENKIQNRIIVVNGLKPNKNFMFFLKAFSQIKNDFSDWVVDVYGHIPPISKYQNNIYNFINTNSLSNQIFIHGITNDIISKYAKSDLHVITSLEENFSLTTLEAMSCGLPTLGFSECFGVRKLIKHNHNGLLVLNSNDLNEFQVKLKTLLRKQNLRERLGKNAYEEAQKYDSDTIYRKWESFFERACDYKGEMERLKNEQMLVDKEKTIHAWRIRNKILEG